MSLKSKREEVVHVFYSYESEDIEWQKSLENHLRILNRQNLISEWHNRKIGAGIEWNDEMRSHLNAADLILLLISPRFLASDHCYDVEMQRALERQQSGEAQALLILLHPVDWQHPPLDGLKVLPQNGKPISTWTNTDEAWLDVATEIRKVVEKLYQLASDFPYPSLYQAEMLRFAQRQVRIRHDYYAGILPPQNYVVRTEVVTNTRNALLSENSSIFALSSGMQENRANALHGMGGIGKTIIARALCDDPIVQDAFPDGILWATLGQKPDLVSLMIPWVEILGGKILGNTQTIFSLKDQLVHLLKDRSCLLILDDAWHRSDVEAFLVGGPLCRLLFTTRDAGIAYDLGAMIQPIPVMSHDESVDLLVRWAKRSFNDAERKVIDRIVRRLGYLPLAVQLAGAQLQLKSPQEWLSTFDGHTLNARRIESVHDSLERTFELSLDALTHKSSSLYIALAIFKEDEAIPLVGIEQLWMGLEQLEPRASLDLLDDLKARALLEITEYQSSITIKVHDLLREFIHVKLGNQYTPTHRMLIEQYSIVCKGNGWDTADDDGYLYDHLVYHLRAAEMIDELKNLFANYHWLHARVAQCHYTYDGYLQDLSLVWEYAVSEARQLIEADREPYNFVDCIRYVLIQTSINSIAASYIPEIVVHAVEIDLWTVQRALSVAAKIPDVAKRAEMYVALLGTTKLDQKQQEVVRWQGFEAALILAKQGLGKMLVALAPWFTVEQREQALEVMFQLESEERVNLLASLIAQLTDKQREWIFKSVLSLPKDDLVKVLVVLAPWLTIAQQEQVFKFAFSLVLQDCIDMLEPLASRLTREQQEKIFEDVVLLEPVERVRAMAIMAYWLTKEQLENVLEVALSLSGWRREKILIALASHVEGESQWKLFEVALTLPHEDRAEVLISLAALVTGELQERLFDATLVLSDWLRTKVLVALAPHVDEKLLKSILEVALRLLPWECKKVLIALAPRLSRKLSDKAFEAIQLLPQQEYIEVLLALVPQLEAYQIKQSFELALAFPSIERVKVLIALTPRLNGYLLERAFEMLWSFDYEEDRVSVLRVLAPRLNRELLGLALERAFVSNNRKRYRRLAEYQVSKTFAQEDMEQLKNHIAEKSIERSNDTIKNFPRHERGDRVERLRKILPRLTEPLLERLLKAALVLPQEEQFDVLEVLIPRLTAKLINLAFEATLTLPKNALADRLAILAPELTREQIKLVLNVIVNLSYKDCEKVLIALAPRLVDELLKGALEIVFTLPSEERIGVLTILQSQLTENLLEFSLTSSLLFPQEEQADIFEVLAPRLTREQAEWVLGIIANFIQKDRTRVLAALAAWIVKPLLERILNEVLMLSQEERVKILPALVPRLSKKQIKYILDETLTLTQEKERAEVLIVLARWLKDEQIEQAFEVTTVLSQRERGKVLTALASQLSGSLVEYALEMSLSLAYEGYIEALVSVIPQLGRRQLKRVFEASLSLTLTNQLSENLFAALASSKQIEQVLEDFLAFPEQTRIELFKVLAPHLKESLLAQTFYLALPEATGYKEMTNTSIVSKKRIEFTMSLSPQIPNSLLEQAFKNALNLPSEDRTEILLSMVPRLTEPLMVQAFEAILAFSIREVRSLLPVFPRKEFARMLIVLAPRLRGESLERAFEITMQVPAQERGKILMALIPQMTEKLLERALEAVLALPDDNFVQTLPSFVQMRKESIEIFLCLVTEEQLKRVLKAALRLSENDLINFLNAVVARLGEEQLKYMLASIYFLPVEDRIKIQILLLPFLQKERDLLRVIWKDSIDALLAFREWSLQDVLEKSFIKDLSSYSIFSPHVLDAIRENVLEICEQWRWL